MYAILSHGGRQHRVSAGDRLVVDRLDAEVGSVIALAPVLLTGGDGTTALGEDVDGTRVAVTVVRHLRGEKLLVFKYKAKKRSRKMAGYRSDLTELRVESILAKGAALPKRAAAARAPSPGAHEDTDTTSEPVTAPAAQRASKRPVATAAGAKAKSHATTAKAATPKAETTGSVTAAKATTKSEAAAKATAKREATGKASSAKSEATGKASSAKSKATGKASSAKSKATGKASIVKPHTAKRATTAKPRTPRTAKSDPATKEDSGDGA
jgi:large subunit ribosomal protein L21